MRVIVNNKAIDVNDGATYLDIANLVKEQYAYDILLVTANQLLCELHKKASDGEVLEFITANQAVGMLTYRRSATFLFLKAFYDVLDNDKIEKVEVQFSLSKGYFILPEGDFVLDEELLSKVRVRMRELVLMDLPIDKKSVHTEKAIELFHQHRMYDKEKLFNFRRVSRVNIYNIENFEDYFYSYMVPSTGYIKYFELYLYDNGLVLQMPDRKHPKEVLPFNPQHKLYKVLKESAKWSKKMNVSTVGDLNERIVDGSIGELMMVQEAWQEQKIWDIVSKIVENGDTKMILIAGPSSSGKTTFSHRLSIQLRAHGLKPHPIPLDNFFVNRIDNPKDEFGNYNFEDIESVDVSLFKDIMSRLFRGENVEMPVYNFLKGEREYRGDYLQLGEEDILVIEGIHCLNERMYEHFPKENAFKIYISALTQLNIDEHNRIPTTDGRLIRRIVRDANTRGHNAQQTIAMWSNVRKGEEKNIFPYQEHADVMFNSALVYELSILKQYAEPLLFGVEKDSQEYIEAKRLLKFLDYFLGISPDHVPTNSIIREFVGGGSFHI